MAFATQNVKLESLGSLWLLSGECTSSIGDANGTITVGGNRVYTAQGYDASAITPKGGDLTVSVNESTTGPTSSVSINCSEGITKGRFFIVYR